MDRDCKPYLSCYDAIPFSSCPLQVFLSHDAFHKFEDQLRALDGEEQRRNRIRDAEAEAGLDVHGLGDPCAPYPEPGADGQSSPWAGGYADAFNASNQAVPLVANTSPFQRADMYDEDSKERRSLRSELELEVSSSLSHLVHS